MLYEGPSQLDGEQGGVALILTGLEGGTLNRKTGDVPQAWIIPTGEGELNGAVREGREGAACGACPQRPVLGGRCYVNVQWAPQRVWYTWQRGGYQSACVPEVIEAVRGGSVRWGAWGDPAAVPLEVYSPILDVLEGWQGYTHQWRNLSARDWGWLMASVDTEAEAIEARIMGWRYFRTADGVAPLLPGEARCPASHEWEAAGHRRLTCQECRQCGGDLQEWRR